MFFNQLALLRFKNVSEKDKYNNITFIYNYVKEKVKNNINNSSLYKYECIDMKCQRH